MECGGHLGHVDSVAHAADHVEVLTAAVGALRLREGDRDPRFGLTRKGAGFRHDADDLVRPIVEPHRLSDDLRVAAETPAPQAVTQDDDGPSIGRVFLGQEPSARGQSQAEHRLKALRHARDDDAFRFAIACEVLAVQPHRRNVRKDVARVPQIVVARRGDRGPRHVGRVPVPHDDESIGMRKWQRGEQHAANDREDRGVGANPERQRQDRDGGESRSADQ